MENHFPLLVFPQARTIDPPKGSGFTPSKPHLPEHDRQVARLDAQLASLQQDFDRYKADIIGSVAGLEPETVLVIEFAGHFDEFSQAVEAIGLEWLGAWGVCVIGPDEDLFEQT